MLANRLTIHELRGDLTPEQSLQLACLADAIGDLRTYQVSQTVVNYCYAQSAWRWLLTDGDRQYPYSFRAVAESLGLDVAWLRTQLCRQLGQQKGTSRETFPTAAKISNPEPAPRQADRQHRATSVEPTTQIAPC